MTARLPGRTYFYFFAQSINLTTAVMSVTMAAIVGAALAPAAKWATLPYGIQFLFLMLATYPASKLMARIGRKKAFMIGAVPLVISGASGYLAIEHQQFWLLALSHAALGIYIAFANFNRFAATDRLDATLKPKALSLVVAGGVIAAVVGPALTELLRDVAGYSLFSLCYASFIVLAALSMLIALWLPEDVSVATPERQATQAKPSPGTTAAVSVAVAVAALGYGIMNLLMIQAAMHMKGMHHDFSDVRWAIQWHVVAMFAPSFFTGTIIQKLGLKTTLCTGLVLLLSCSAINVASHAYAAMMLSLIVLGLGWNLTYVGGGALLAHALKDNAAAIPMQGRNDLVIAVFATLGAFTPALLLSTIGWYGTNALCMAIVVALLLISAVLLRNPKVA